jgi:hypothetical protein
MLQIEVKFKIQEREVPWDRFTAAFSTEVNTTDTKVLKLFKTKVVAEDAVTSEPVSGPNSR